MLNYLVDITNDIIILMIIGSFSYAYSKKKFGAVERKIMWIGGGVGILAATAMTLMRNLTSLIDTSIWNLIIFYVAIPAFAVFIVFTALRRPLKKVGSIIQAVSLAVLNIAVFVFYLPIVFETPYLIIRSEESFFSTEVMLNLAGMAIALILTYCIAHSIYRFTQGIGSKILFALVVAAYGCNTLKYVALGLTYLRQNKVIPSVPWMVQFSLFFRTNSWLFIAASLVIMAIAAVIVIVKGAVQKEPYNNPAEKRKIISKWRSFRRWAIFSLVCGGLVVFVITGLDAIANQEIEKAPVEDTKIEGDYVVVDFTQVEDGHLHRFAYTSEKGTEIKFIVVKKENSSAYGVGLDACDICGNAGYYERNNEVVCSRCDVVMNKNTIGFKGGCNPIIIDYTVDDNQILVSIDSLLEHEKEFE